MSHTVTFTDNGFKKGTLNSTAFSKDQDFKWDFQSGAMILQNDGIRPIEYSFNGKDVAGDLTPADRWISLDIIRQTSIWLRLAPGAPPEATVPYRFRVWRGEG